MRAVMFVLIFAGVIHLNVKAQSKEISNSEIRDAILSLVHSYSLLDNKLERHEQRERALGELIKKGLLTLQKNQRIFEPMKGLIQRLEDRVGQIETRMLDQEEKIREVLTDILSFMKDSNHAIRTIDKTAETNNSSVLKTVETLTENVKGLRIQIGELRSTRTLAEEMNKELAQKTEQLVETKLSSVNEVMTKIEDKLKSFYVVTNGNGNGHEWTENLNISITNIEKSLMELPDRQFMQKLINETLESITDMRLEVLTASDKSFSKTGNRIKESFGNIETQLNDILKSVIDTGTVTEHFHSICSADNLTKIEQILVQTGDSVLDLKRRLEYGVHQILLEVNDLVKEGTNGINDGIVKRLDELDSTLMANISGKIESELSQVWRQIGIMYQEISSSKLALDKLHQQTEMYVNGTVTSMDSMQGKMSLVTGRMAEVDENLNYLLGRLSLVTQEFGQIKTGLSSALESIRNSFKAVQEQVKDTGPGPHDIPNSKFGP